MSEITGRRWSLCILLVISVGLVGLNVLENNPLKEFGCNNTKEHPPHLPPLNASKLVHQNLRISNFEHPFVFFHLRKTAGSFLRSSMMKAAKNASISHFIPCFEGLTCESYFIPKNVHFQMYGGHLHYVDVENSLLHKRWFELQDPPEKEPSIDCLVSIRPTVDRVQSCWNYRFVQGQHGHTPMKAAHEMMAQEWDELLPASLSMYREGCNNEFARIFGTALAENVINNFDDSDHYAAAIEVRRIQERVSRCVVFTQHRCKESKLVMEHYIPWLAPFVNCGIRENKGAIEKAQLQDGLAAEVILKHNQLDEEVYQFAIKLFEEQLAIATQQ